MFSPTFKIDKNQHTYINGKYISNGHWLITRTLLLMPTCPKPLKALGSLMHGNYHGGIAHECDTDPKSIPDMESVIPKRDGYLPLSNGGTPTGIVWRNEWYIRAYKFEFTFPTVVAKIKPEDPGVGTMQKEIGIDVKYAPLLRLGHCFAKAPGSLVLILDGNTLNDNLLALVMPVRL